jgi:hypothetical protein
MAALRTLSTDGISEDPSAEVQKGHPCEDLGEKLVGVGSAKSVSGKERNRMKGGNARTK